MKLQVGLSAPSPAWEQILLQEGISCDVIDVGQSIAADAVSVLVVTQPLSAAGREVTVRYLRDGGGVLGYVRHLEGVGGTGGRPENLEYVTSHETDPLRWITLLDLGLTGEIPREANVARTQMQTIALFAGRLLEGSAVLLPFDVAAAFADTRTAEKNFYARRDRLPSERVSLVGKGELRHLIHGALEYLHHARGLPYCHLWYFPEGAPSVFALRIDTDGAPPQDVDVLYDISRESDIGFSWYLDVGAHESWLARFGMMVDQELGVHCYEHRVFDSHDDSMKDISRARRVLEEAGVRTEGYAAPFGQWNPAIARALVDLGFMYSSEFSLAYDTLPFFPIVNDVPCPVLQVPIHPICIGSLRRVGYTPQNMNEYFGMAIEQKLARHEPVFFYHHPTHRSWDVVRSLLASVQKMNIVSTTLGAYAHWWKARIRVARALTFDGHVVSVPGEPASGAGNVWLRISRSPGEEAIVPFNPRISLDDAAWSRQAPVSIPSDVQRIREFDSRKVLGDLYTRMVRRFK